MGKNSIAEVRSLVARARKVALKSNPETRIT
jgi:hypothetical protein